MALQLIESGVVPLAGMRDGLLALRNAAWLSVAAQTELSTPVWLADQRKVTAIFVQCLDDIANILKDIGLDAFSRFIQQ